MMDQNLTWTEHVNEVVQKCNKILFPLAKHGTSLSQAVLAKLVQALVIPHLTYCAPIWGGLCTNQRQRLQNILNRAARIVTTIPRGAHITPILRQLGGGPSKTLSNSGTPCWCTTFCSHRSPPQTLGHILFVEQLSPATNQGQAECSGTATSENGACQALCTVQGRRRMERAAC